MQALSGSDLAEIHKRFGEFGDAVVPAVSITSGHQGTAIRIEFEAIDLTLSEKDILSWARVEFLIENVNEFRIEQKANIMPIFIVYSGKVTTFEGRFFIGLDDRFDASSIDGFRKSDFYVSGETLSWHWESLQHSAWSGRKIGNGS